MTATDHQVNSTATVSASRRVTASLMIQAAVTNSRPVSISAETLSTLPWP